MAAKKVGELIKEARTEAGLSQEGLAKKIDGLSASDLGKAERGEKELTQAQLKAIAKATGVTQISLLEAPKGGSGSTAKKTTSAAKISSTAKKTSGSAKKTSSTSSKKTSSAVELTAAEKTLLNAYRKADADRQKAALKLLKGEQTDDLLSSLISGAMDMLGNLGKK
jgi:transcriptional regulator with XRE-family HTH domain